MKSSIAQLFDLSGKTAIVTGGAMGIGQGIALRLAEAGAGVVIADLNQEHGQATIKQIQSIGGSALFIQANVSNTGEIHKVIADTLHAFGSLDILVNNAGVYPLASALDLTEDSWDRVLDINLKGAFFFAQAAARQMVQAGHGGRIVNIASIDAVRPTGLLAHYDASKGGIVMMTKALALELGHQQITVNVIAPGAIETPGAAKAPSISMENSRITTSATASFVSRIPLGRQGTPDDIGKVALFLASGASDYINGAVIVVDGGYLLS